MAKIWSGVFLAAVIAVASPAFAKSPVPLTGATAVSGFNTDQELVPNVKPGDEIIVACAPIEQRQASDDVRVVLTIAAVPSEVSPGFSKVLATNEQLNRYGVRVRVPDVPDLPDHTVNLNIYVVGEKTRGCDGGHLRVVRRSVPDFRHEVKLTPIS